jgi:predicted component of type VI protein secretion system
LRRRSGRQERELYMHSDDSSCKVIACIASQQANNGANPKYTFAMTLAPKTPPGRRTRKARQFHVEIRQLHAAGYSCQTICEALAALGVQVHRTTVYREVARPSPPAVAHHPQESAVRPSSRPPPGLPPAQPEASGASLITKLAADKRSSKDIAAEFMKNFNSNPLLRDKEHR